MTAVALDFVMPPIHDNPSGWGPLSHFPIEGLENIPIETLAKSDRMARVADFTANAKGGGKGWGGPRVRADSEEEDFTLVDTHAPRPLGFKGKGKGKGKGKSPFFKGGFGKGFGKGDENLGINPRTGKPDPLFEGKGLHANVFPKGKGPNAKGKGKGKGKGKRGGKNAFREWSVQVDPEWTVREENVLPENTHLKIKDAAKLVTREDIAWCGSLQQYDKAYDRVTPKLEKNLQKFDDVCFYNVTAIHDPIMQEAIMDDEKAIDVAVTDQLLAALMTANRSMYSWDIVVTRAEDKLFLDKRDGSHIDYTTVNETSSDPPQNDDKDAINAPMKLGSEASAINQNFSQQILNSKVPAKQMENPNPFVEEDDSSSVASCAYRYQKITLPGNPKSQDPLESRDVSMVVRSDVDCLMPESTPTNPIYCSTKSLNEYNAKGTTGWRYCIESQRGAVLATELKNNSFKLARWTAQAMIAGVDFIKFGYVTRKLHTDPGRHSILSVQTYKVGDFAQQIGLTQDNAWAVVRQVVDQCLKLPPGKYLYLKDPAKSIMRLYDVPWETFEEEDEEDEDEEDEYIDDAAMREAPGKGPK